jgi:hypothetical protein
MATSQLAIYTTFASILVILLCIGFMLKYREKFDEDDIPVIYMDELYRNPSYNPKTPAFHPINPTEIDYKTGIEEDVGVEEKDMQRDGGEGYVTIPVPYTSEFELDCLAPDASSDQLFETLDEGSCM